jgi:hypothetical protein
MFAVPFLCFLYVAIRSSPSGHTAIHEVHADLYCAPNNSNYHFEILSSSGSIFLHSYTVFEDTIFYIQSSDPPIKSLQL